MDEKINRIIMDYNENSNKGILTAQKHMNGFYSLSLGASPIISGISAKEAFLIVASIRNYAKLTQ